MSSLTDGQKLAIVSGIIFVVIIIAVLYWYFYIKKPADEANNKKIADDAVAKALGEEIKDPIVPIVKDPIVPVVPIVKDPIVTVVKGPMLYLINSGDMDYASSLSACEGNSDRLATVAELKMARDKGFEACALGWTSDKQIAFAMQKTNNQGCATNSDGLFLSKNNVLTDKHNAYCVTENSVPSGITYYSPI